MFIVPFVKNVTASAHSHVQTAAFAQSQSQISPSLSQPHFLSSVDDSIENSTPRSNPNHLPSPPPLPRNAIKGVLKFIVIIVAATVWLTQITAFILEIMFLASVKETMKHLRPAIHTDVGHGLGSFVDLLAIAPLRERPPSTALWISTASFGLSIISALTLGVWIWNKQSPRFQGRPPPTVLSLEMGSYRERSAENSGDGVFQYPPDVQYQRHDAEVISGYAR